ncbi:MAG: VOC family protein [Nitrospinae bacterium]|nr:VOC family protein [Nitrospinota bacterium]
MKEKRKSTAVWFEIPAKDFGRAVEFYEKVFATKLTADKAMPVKMAVFPYSDCNETTGCVKEDPKGAGGKNGVVVYLNTDGFLNDAIKRVQQAGGKVLGPVIELPMDMGSYVLIEDTEGNKVGFHDAI